MRARLRERRLGGGRIANVAVDDDRNRHRLDRLAHRRPVCRAGIELAARAPVHCQHLHALGLGNLAELRRGAAGIIPAEAHLQRHRPVAGALDGRIDDLACEAQITHQRRARLAAGHFLGRAAHVDVDDVHARFRHQTRALQHVAGAARGELDDPETRALMPAGAANHVRPGLGERLARDHFGDHRGSTKPYGLPAHGRVRRARHRRQPNTRCLKFDHYTIFTTFAARASAQIMSSTIFVQKASFLRQYSHTGMARLEATR